MVAFDRPIEMWSGGSAKVESAILTGCHLLVRTQVEFTLGTADVERPDKVISAILEQNGETVPWERKGASAGQWQAQLAHEVDVDPDLGPVTITYRNAQSEVSTTFEIDLEQDLLGR
ncbi:hypothetical protein ACLE50_05845 [Pseudonocardia sp. 1LY6.1]